jgi:alcohol dehydrogenase YqhD (iron-dependent ADH family)
MKFQFYNPTKVFFGVGEFSRSGELAATIGKKCLLVIGQGSVERQGYLAKLEDMLKKAGVGFIVFKGVEANPHVETCIIAAKKAIAEQCDFVLGLGGGSVMDACKAIAAAFFDPDNLWTYIYHGEDNWKPVQQALPIMVIPTLAATGSEMDSGGVITRWETREKCVIGSPLLFPRISVIDPELTLTVPLDYTMDGVFDVAVHVMESYFNGNQDALLQGRLIEAMLAVVFEEGEKLFHDSSNLKLRENVQWPSSLALSGFFTSGRGGGYPVHQLEHVLSARWNISHGRGLALIMPRWMWYSIPFAPEPFARFAHTVMGIKPSSDRIHDAQKGVNALVNWLQRVELFFTLDELEIESAMLESAADDAMRLYSRKGTIDALKPLQRADVLAIYKMCEVRDFMM